MKRLVLRLALVPPEPHVPEGSPESTRVFNAGRNYFYLRILLWVLGNLGTAAVLIPFTLAGLFIADMPPWFRAIWLTVAAVAIVLFLISLPFTFFVQRLNYEMRWYIVTDRSLRIRSGIVFLKELTMTFANIQEIRVSANPIERLLGLANVEVHSAGGGVNAHGVSTSHLGRFEGIDNASAVRDLIVERLRIYRDSGLGEQPRVAAGGPSRQDHATAAAQEVLAEVRALRQALAAVP